MSTKKGKNPKVTVAQGDAKGDESEADYLVVEWQGWVINLSEDGFLKVEKNGIEKLAKELLEDG